MKKIQDLNDIFEIYSLAIQSLAPGAEFALRQDSEQNTEITISSIKLEWIDKNIQEPSIQQIELEIQRLKEEYLNNEYQLKRENEYPPLQDFVDAYYWAQKGNTSLMDEYISKCDQVKNKYPKS